MLDLGSWGEILIIVVAALILLGPKELPVVLKTIGRVLHHVRRITQEMRQSFSHYIHEGEFEEYTRQKKPVKNVMRETQTLNNNAPNTPKKRTRTVSQNKDMPQ